MGCDEARRAISRVQSPLVIFGGDSHDNGAFGDRVGGEFGIEIDSCVASGQTHATCAREVLDCGVTRIGVDLRRGRSATHQPVFSCVMAWLDQAPGAAVRVGHAVGSQVLAVVVVRGGAQELIYDFRAGEAIVGCSVGAVVHGELVGSPLCVERDGAAVDRREVFHLGAVSSPAPIGFGIPFSEGVAGALETVGSEFVGGIALQVAHGGR